MKTKTWNVIGPALVLIVAIFIVVTYIYDQRVQRTVVGHMPDPSDVPGLNVYGAGLTASDEGKAFLRRWEINRRRWGGTAYDLEIILNDPEFFRDLAAVEGRGGAKEDEIYQSYAKRYQFDRKLVFTVMMHSAKGQLLEQRPERRIRLRVDEGAEYEPENLYETNRSMEYHRQAVVAFGRSDGTSIVSPKAKILELVLLDPSGASTRIVRWNLETEGRQ
jgi:hypothetical protein